MRRNVPKTLIDRDRIDQITEIGVIDGGEWADVLAVSYGATDRTVRIRFEATGERREFDVPEGLSLEQMLEMSAEALYYMFAYESKPAVAMYRGRQARKWVRRLIGKAELAAEEAEASGVVPQTLVNDEMMPRLMIEMTHEPAHWFN